MPNVKSLTPGQLWECLIERAGLELRLKQRPGRDADMELAVLQQLDPASGTAGAYPTIKALLTADQGLPVPTVTVERLLIAVLESQKGFAAMMNEILETLVMAEATLGESNLEFEFNFDEVAGPLRLTLGQFQAYAVRTHQVCSSHFVPLSQQQRWQINSILSDLRVHWGSRPNDRLPDAPQVSARSAPARFHAPLLALETAVADFLQSCRSVGSSRTGNFRDLQERQKGTPKTAEQQEEFERIIDATDFWDVSIVDTINYIKDGLSTRDLDPDRTFDTLMQAVVLMPVKQQWIDESYQEVLDLLSLPTWKRRHELYSVWVGTRLLNVAKKHASQLEFHPRDRVLSFAFGGSSLASYVANSERFSIRCEVRSELVGASRKRKRAIQPDFRVLREDGTATTNDATRLVVECKHYLQPSISNFSSAANDYARSCRYATVLVVNHGPLVEAALLNALEPEVRNRTRLMGNVAPNASDGLYAFIRAALFSAPATMPSAPVQRSQPDAVATSVVVRLERLTHPQVLLQVEWDESLQDLDLALAFDIGTTNSRVVVDFKNRGGMEAPSYAQLQEDVQAGPGIETITIYELKAKRYEVFVSNYSEPGNFPVGHLRGRITLGNTTLVVNPPKHRACLGEWRMAVLLVNADGTVTIQI
jgi:hypothetical protein